MTPFGCHVAGAGLIGGIAPRVDRGMHVHGREFGFVIATPRNRRAFVQLVHTSYPGLDDHGASGML